MKYIIKKRTDGWFNYRVVDDPMKAVYKHYVNNDAWLNGEDLETATERVWREGLNDHKTGFYIQVVKRGVIYCNGYRASVYEDIDGHEELDKCGIISERVE